MLKLDQTRLANRLEVSVQLPCSCYAETRYQACNSSEDSTAMGILSTALNVLNVVPLLGEYSGIGYSLKNSTNSTVAYPSITGDPKCLGGTSALRRSA
jgi:hypothetical protein